MFVLVFGDLWADVCDVKRAIMSDGPAKVQSKGSVSDLSVKWAKDKAGRHARVRFREAGRRARLPHKGSFIPY